MKSYRVEVEVGEFLTGTVYVRAETLEDAKGEAEELIKAQSVEAVKAWEVDGPVPCQHCGAANSCEHEFA